MPQISYSNLLFFLDEKRYRKISIKATDMKTLKIVLSSRKKKL
jgi:hypothetical protein